jgi:hypothetical protein
VPLVRWKTYQERLPTEVEVFNWNRRWPVHNVGLATGHLSGIVVMDLDGELAIRVAEARGYAPGPGVFTGRVGGQHRYFRWREDAPRNFAKRDGIDFRGEGGYVILPPSRHSLGRDYVWDEDLGELDDLPSLPDWMTTLGTERARQVTAVVDEDIAEGQRNQRLTSIGGALRRHGADAEAILSALLDINARQCRPPLSVGEVASITQSVARYTPEPDDAPRMRLRPREQPAGQALEAPRWLTAASIESIEDEDVTWLAYGLVGQGLTTELDGKVKKSGKTTLVLSLCRAILNGEQFLGQPTVRTPIVYLTEQSGPSFKRNLRDAGLLGQEEFHLLLWNDVRDRDWPTIITDAHLKLRETGALLLVIDTLGHFSRVRGDDENKSGAAMKVMEPVLAVAADGVAVLLNRHDRKSGGEVGDSGRGSSAYAGAVDIVLHLERPEARAGSERQRMLDGLSRFEETPEKLLIELTSRQPFTYTALGDVADVRDRRLRIEILSCLPTNPEDAMREKELQEMVEARAVDFRRVLRRLLNEGEVIRIGPGKPGHPYLLYQRVWDEAI